MNQRFDWVDQWRQIVVAREGQETRLRGKAGLTTSNLWDERADRFRSGIQRGAGRADRFLELLSSYVTPQRSVLDVGAGFGRHALPLAKLVKQVIAVEPSQGMRRFLEADAAKQGLRNLSVVPSTWEEAQVEPCDIVYCSHVVYRVLDIRRFIEKLRDHTKGTCFIAIRTSQRDSSLRELWRLVHGEERSPEPGFIDLYNALHQSIGVSANVEVMPSRIGRSSLSSFETLEEAMTQVRSQLCLPEKAPEEARVRDYLKERLIVQDGRLALPGPLIGEAVLWWDNRPGSWNFSSA